MFTTKRIPSSAFPARESMGTNAIYAPKQLAHNARTSTILLRRMVPHAASLVQVQKFVNQPLISQVVLPDRF